MKFTTKTLTFKTLLVVSLFCSTATLAFAGDGQMGSGGKTRHSSNGSSTATIVAGENSSSALSEVYSYLATFLTDLLSR